jgi:ankyrin repeat protein
MLAISRRALVIIAALTVSASFAKTDSIQDAAWRGDLKAVQAFVAQGVGVDDHNPQDGSTPLMLAAAKDSTEVARFLIERGADLNARDLQGNTALHEAAYTDSEGVVKLLIGKGADVNAIDLKGRTPLHRAAGSQIKLDPQLIDYLIAHGARVNAHDGEGDTPLHAAVGLLVSPDISAVSVDKIAERLVAHGADVKAVNNDKQTPCDLAKALNHFGMCLSLEFIFKPK